MLAAARLTCCAALLLLTLPCSVPVPSPRSISPPLPSPPIAVDAATTNGCTPLYIAANNGFAEAAALLLDLGADPDVETTSGCTPLHAGATALPLFSLLWPALLWLVAAACLPPPTHTSPELTACPPLSPSARSPCSRAQRPRGGGSRAGCLQLRRGPAEPKRLLRPAQRRLGCAALLRCCSCCCRMLCSCAVLL